MISGEYEDYILCENRQNIILFLASLDEFRVLGTTERRIDIKEYRVMKS